MMHVEQLQLEIEALPRREFMRLRTWFLQKDWGNWDQQLAEDVSNGKLDFLLEEALIAKEQRSLREL